MWINVVKSCKITHFPPKKAAIMYLHRASLGWMKPTKIDGLLGRSFHGETSMKSHTQRGWCVGIPTESVYIPSNLHVFLVKYSINGTPIAGCFIENSQFLFKKMDDWGYPHALGMAPSTSPSSTSEPRDCCTALAKSTSPLAVYCMV